MNEKLQSLCKQWDDETKGNMLESIINDLENGYSLEQSLDTLINENFPLWIREADTNDKGFYIEFQKKFASLYNEYKIAKIKKQ